MTLTTHLIVSVTFALILSLAVIGIAGYYESPALLFSQIFFIAGPSLAPHLILPKSGRIGVISWLTIAVLLIAGWSYVVYIDTRPYQGGGASLALLFGWFACVIACAVALLIRFLHGRYAQRR